MSSTNDFRYDVGDGPRDRSLRVGDKERDAVSETLRQRHLEGRLDTDEFQARLERCLAAKTYAELDELIADFPPEGQSDRWDRQSWRWRPWPLLFPFLFLPLALVVAIAVGARLWWLAIPLFFLFVVRPLAWGAWGRGYRRGFSACGPRRATRA